MPELLLSPLIFVLSAVAIIIAISVHEFAHAAAADYLGDPTPRLAGRLTLNPLAHLDPIGTLMLLFFRFGWGKPVQFDPFNLRNPRRDSALISLAGPASNIVFAIILSVFYRLMSVSPVSLGLLSIFLLPLVQSLIAMNIILAVFNLLPIHPLDGFKIVGGILSSEQARQWYQLERYGMIFLLFLILPLFGNTSPIHNLIFPPINFLFKLLMPQGDFI